jgi:hypothetical protein
VTVNRRTLLWVAAALLGIVATATVAWSASRLASTSVGLAGAPLSVTSGLAPVSTASTPVRSPARGHRATSRQAKPRRTKPLSPANPAPTPTVSTPTVSTPTVSSAPTLLPVTPSPPTTTTTHATASHPQQRDDSNSGGSGGSNGGRDD